ncbi:hypothetical protein F2P81_006127 [Scophthalmus maximus]|uniref:Uncharacterized protein n=1 Tax=Scophthalmus maximus TaxID=52904 RepID=A0A6A4TBI2_SCOMX|nr:hypothetical protein F2P81_006127 [Scophthalmus maximus]
MDCHEENTFPLDLQNESMSACGVCSVEEKEADKRNHDEQSELTSPLNDLKYTAAVKNLQVKRNAPLHIFVGHSEGNSLFLASYRWTSRDIQTLQRSSAGGKKRETVDRTEFM